jgi:hypothetical protein
MPRIRCHYSDCSFLDDGFCSAAQVELDPDTGCNTFSPNTEAIANEEWEDEEEEWEEVSEDDEEEDDMWLDEDETEEY